jgi:hypothetical protein
MRILFAAVLAAIASALVPGSVYAQSNEAILQRLDALEKASTALRDHVRQIESRKQAPVTVEARPDTVLATSKTRAAYADASVLPARAELLGIESDLLRGT